MAVNDASVLIDFAYGELVGHWFALGIETYITDAVFSEVKAGGHARLFTKFVDAGLLKVDRISSDGALGWLSKVQSYAESLKISFADATALICAEEKEAILLTGDRLLRLQAEKYGVDVRSALGHGYAALGRDHRLSTSHRGTQRSSKSRGKIAGRRLPGSARELAAREKNKTPWACQ